MPAITRSRWHDLWPYLDRALDLPLEKRGAVIADLRVVDPELANDLQTLLNDHEAMGRDGFLAEAGAVADRPDAVLAGHRIGAYTLVSQIGRGGMGTVWLAERSDGRFTGKVAV